MKKTLHRTIIVVASVIGVFIVCEAAFRLVVIIRRDPPIRTLVEFDPVLRYRMSANVSGAMTTSPQGELIVVTTDSRGYRKTGESETDKPRVMFVGDSLLFGYHNQNDQTIPYFLSELMPSYEIVNAAVPGYSSIQIVKAVEREMSDPRNAAFVIDMGSNDFGHIYRGEWKPDSIPNKNLYLCLKLFKHSYFLSFVFKRVYLIFGGLGRQIVPWDTEQYVRNVKERPERRVNSAEFYSTLRERVKAIDSMAAERGIPVFLLPIPNLIEDGLDPDQERMMLPIFKIMPVSFGQFQREIGVINNVLKEAAESSSHVRFVDVNPTLRAGNQIQNFTDGTHLTAAGNRLAASVLLKALTPIAQPRKNR